MKKQIVNCLFAALTIGALASLNAGAADSEAGSNIIISESDSISITSENAANDGITAIQLSIRVEPAADANVSFDFNQENDVKITDFRYHEDSDILNIYLADSEPVFNGSDTIELGSVYAADSEGNAVDVNITPVDDSMKFVSQNTLTSKSFTVQDQAAVTTTETTEASPGTDSSDQTTTTTAAGQDADTSTTPANTGDQQVVVEKTFEQSYEIVIPDSTDSLAEGQTFNLSAANVLIPHGQTFKVSVTSSNGWKLRDKNNPENPSLISYLMRYGDNESGITNKTETVLTVGNGAGSGNVDLTVISIDDPQMAGTFSDTLTFNVDIS